MMKDSLSALAEKILRPTFLFLVHRSAVKDASSSARITNHPHGIISAVSKNHPNRSAQRALHLSASPADPCSPIFRNRQVYTANHGGGTVACLKSKMEREYPAGEVNFPIRKSDWARIWPGRAASCLREDP